MKIVKIILEGSLVIPQTTAEAVAVLNKGNVTTLDKILDKKIEQVIPVDLSGLKVILQGTNIFINHTNEISPLPEAKAKIIAYDNHGHVTLSKDLGKHSIMVNGEVLTEYTGNEDVSTEFGDDFIAKDSKIQLNWNNI